MNLQADLQAVVEQAYGLDVAQAEISPQGGGWLLRWPGGPAMLRVKVNSVKSRAVRLSENLWMDDLKLTADSICQPLPSRNNRLQEEIEVGASRYALTLVEATAAAASLAQPTADQLQAAGALLGRIHAASQDGARLGFHYTRKRWEEILTWGQPPLAQAYGPQAAKIAAVVDKLRAFPESEGSFGMIHGNYTWRDLHDDGSRLRVYDFDSCMYGFYVFDAACACLAWLEATPLSAGGSAALLAEHILPPFRAGYESACSLPESHWQSLPSFFPLSVAFTLLTLAITPAADQAALAQEQSRQLRRLDVADPLAATDLYRRLCAGLTE